MDITKLLFSFFPREYGRYRQVVTNYDDLVKLINRDNGLMDVYVSVYDKNLHIDKVIWDIDSRTPSGLNVALEEAKRLYNLLMSKGIPTLPVFSGKKGFHIYAFFRPLQLNVVTASELIRNIQEQFIIQAKVRLADSHLIGNVSALIRVPNTLNWTRFCVPLPDKFVNWSITDILNYALEPHNGIEINGYRPDIRDFYNPEIMYPTGKPATFIDEKSVIPSNVKELLRYLLRPCIFALVTNIREPPHFARVELVTELSALGYNVDELVEIIKRLNWADFDESITRKYVEKYVNYIPYSCRRLRYMGVRCPEDCHWHYFWKKEREVVKCP